MPRSPLSIALVSFGFAAVVYYLSLSYIFPGYFAPFVPHHSDMYIPAGLLERPLTEVITFPRPVAYVALRTMGVAGVAGSIAIVVGVILAGVALTAVLCSRFNGRTPGLLAIAAYCLILFAHPQFYFQHRHDVPAALSYALMISAVLLADKWAEKQWSRASGLAYVATVTALGLTKETYAAATVVLVTAVLVWRFGKVESLRVARVAGLSIVVLGSTMGYNILRYKHFLASATEANQPYQPSLHPSSVAPALAYYLRELASPAALLIFGAVSLGFVFHRRSSFIPAAMFVAAAVCSLLPHAVLPNHLEGHYAWVAAPVAFAPVLFLQFSGWRGVAVGALLTAACTVWTANNRKSYGAVDRQWTIAQEKGNARVMASFDRLRALPASARRVLVTGLRLSYHPWQTKDFVRRELGRGRSWTVITAGGNAPAVSAPVTLTSPRGQDPASFDAVLVYDSDGRLVDTIVEGTKIAAAAAPDPDVLLIPELKPHFETLRRRPDDFMALLTTGSVYGDWGWPERAIPYLDRAMAASPRNPYPHFFMGKAAEALGDISRAYRHYQDAAARDTPPGNPVFREAVERLKATRKR